MIRSTTTPEQVEDPRRVAREDSRLTRDDPRHGQRRLPTCASRFPSPTRLLTTRSKTTTTIAAAGAGIAVLIMFLSARLDGVTDGQTPVFAPRNKYELTNHGKQTAVSKFRDWTVGTSFSVGWHSMVLLFSIYSIRAFMFGDLFDGTRKQTDSNHNPDCQ